MTATPVVVRTAKGAIPLPAPGCHCPTCDFNMDNPNAVEPVCSGCNTDCEYCSCQLHLSPKPDPCGHCPVVCGNRVGVERWMIAVGGTVTFDDLQLSNTQPAAPLPRFIPVVDTNRVMAELDAGLRWPAYAVRLRSVISDRTYQITPSYANSTAHQTLRLNPTQAAVLNGYAQDPLVEAVWTNRHQLAERFAAQEWTLVVGPDLSVYGSSPRFDQLLNMRRQLLLTDILGRAGVTAAPNLSWFRLEDLQRLEQLLARTQPKLIAVNLQMQKQESAWHERLLPGLAYLSSGLPPETTLVVSGPSSLTRLRQLRALFPHTMLLSSNATILARKRSVMTDTGRQPRPGAAVSDCFAQTARWYEQALN